MPVRRLISGIRRLFVTPAAGELKYPGYDASKSASYDANKYASEGDAPLAYDEDGRPLDPVMQEALHRAMTTGKPVVAHIRDDGTVDWEEQGDD